MFHSTQLRIWLPQRDAPLKPPRRGQYSVTPLAGNRLRPR